MSLQAKSKTFIEIIQISDDISCEKEKEKLEKTGPFDYAV